MTNWKSHLKADPTQWLLGEDCPSIRYRTLTDILDEPNDAVEVHSAREAILISAPVANLFTLQATDGSWGNQDFYLPRAGNGTFWVLSILGDMGLTADEEPIHRACSWMFNHQHPNGSFCRRRRMPRQGVVWMERTEPCTQARIVRFLIQFGYAEDPRLRRAINWLLPLQREDGTWLCREGDRHGCLRATLDVLRVAAMDPPTAALPEVTQAAQNVCGLLMEPRMSRYHVGEKWGTWECLKYPYFGISILSALETLARLGFSAYEPQIAAGIDYLLSRQLEDGKWPMDESWADTPIDFGKPGEPSKWITLDALRVIKLFYGPD